MKGLKQSLHLSFSHEMEVLSTKHIDILYDSLRYGLFAQDMDEKTIYLVALRKSDLKSVQYAGDIFETWLAEFPDDSGPLDYWNMKWLLLKTIQVKKRLRWSIDSVVELCLHLVEHPREFEKLETSMIRYEFRDIPQFGGKIRLKDVV